MHSEQEKRLNTIRPKVKHEIPEHLTNTQVIYLIDEYVRLERDRDILKDHWFKGITLEALAEKCELSTNKIKKIIYDIGDTILLKT